MTETPSYASDREKGPDRAEAKSFLTGDGHRKRR